MTSGPGQDGLPVPRRYWSAATIWLAIAMAVLDGTIANVALPTMARELAIEPAISVWIVNAYQLTITVLLLPLAALGDRIGYHKVYFPALALFTVGSATCAMSPSFDSLLVARIVQGVGAAGIMSMNAALVRATYPSTMLGRGMGYNALVLSMAAALGPTLAAIILSVASWRWLFLINVPIGIGALSIAIRALPRAPGRGGRLDWPSALLSAAMLGGIVFGAETFARAGSRLGAGLIVLGVVAGVVLVRRERRDPAPLMPLDLLRIPIFTLSIVTSVVSFAAQMLAYVALPFYFQSVLGRSVFETGLLMTPWPIAVGCAAPFAGRLSDRVPSGLLGGIGMVVFGLGLFLLSRLGASPDNLDIAWRMAICGLGFGFFQSPNNREIIISAPRNRSGAAGGMLATGRLLGQTAGAVSVGVAFHVAGVDVSPDLLLAAAIAAILAAAISLFRLRLKEPAPQLKPATPIVK
jgi:DHA2 family multidrug resistance protein-like MFS transporter